MKILCVVSVLFLLITIFTQVALSDPSKHNYKHISSGHTKRRDKRGETVEHKTSVRKRRKYEISAEEDSPEIEKSNESVEFVQNEKEVVDWNESNEVGNDYENKIDRQFNVKHQQTKKRIKPRYSDAESNSIEILLPTRHRPSYQYEYNAAERPFYNLLLGILDTCHMTTRQELKRAQDRQRKARSQQFFDDLKNNINDNVHNITSLFLPPILQSRMNSVDKR